MSSYCQQLVMARWPSALTAAAVSLTVAAVLAEAALVQHTFYVGSMEVEKLCKKSVIVTVNGQMPGPTIYVQEGDTLVVNIINLSRHSITIHWHGIFQLLSAWDDGANMITQCPIRPGKSYTYAFKIVGQEGTLWWHAHSSFLRATVYGALIILPRNGSAGFPFSLPYQQVPILLGEWWSANVIKVERDAFLSGGAAASSDAITINGQPGDFYPCSSRSTFRLSVVSGKTYLLRVINSALITQLFFKIAGHRFTVVAADASYTTPYATDVLVLAPGQTVDVLMAADAAPGRYYLAARAYVSSPTLPAFDKTTATAVVEYANAPLWAAPLMPALPLYTDTATAHRFYTGLTGLLMPATPTVPLKVDVNMFVTFGLGGMPCGPKQLRCNTTLGALAASMNNVSFQFPKRTSLLEAYFRGVSGVYTADFPDAPPVVFDYTGAQNQLNPALLSTVKGTRVKRVAYNSVVEVVLQGTSLIGVENHPIHLHGFNFFVVAQGFGNYNPATAARSFNLVNPQVRNTIGVPAGGWAVIRFVANNPGVWFMHCHLDSHLPIGLAMAFQVENGTSADSTFPPPPSDFPPC